MQRGYKSYTAFIKDSMFPKASLNMNTERRKQTQESSQLFSSQYAQLHAWNENGEQHLSNCIRATSRMPLASAHTGVSMAIWIILEHPVLPKGTDWRNICFTYPTAPSPWSN